MPAETGLVVTITLCFSTTHFPSSIMTSSMPSSCSVSLGPKEGAIFGERKMKERFRILFPPGCRPIYHVPASSYFSDCVQAVLRFPPDSPRPGLGFGHFDKTQLCFKNFLTRTPNRPFLRLLSQSCSSSSRFNVLRWRSLF